MNRAAMAVGAPDLPPAHPRAPRRRRCAAAAGALAVWWLAAGTALAATPADYFREDRWAQEVVPGLVVGDAVYLATPSRPRVLAILTEPAGAAKGGVVVVHGLGAFRSHGCCLRRPATPANTRYRCRMPHGPSRRSGCTRHIAPKSWG